MSDDFEKPKIYGSRDLWEKIKPLARQMRHDPTPAESKLWDALRKARGF
jgi:very-short-patch-repair endonuclease